MSVPIAMIFITYDLMRGPSFCMNSSNIFQSGISTPSEFLGNNNESSRALLTNGGKSFKGLSLTGSGKNSIIS